MDAVVNALLEGERRSRPLPNAKIVNALLGVEPSPARSAATPQMPTGAPFPTTAPAITDDLLYYGSLPAKVATGLIQGAAESAWSGLTYPGDVLAGKARPDDIGRTLDSVGVIGLRGLQSALPKSMKKLASRSVNIYDPPVQKPRSFEADYPAGASADAAGNLVSDIDGRPLSARYVVGRREVSGPDMALPPEALDEIAKARTGEAIRYSAPGSKDLGRDVGRASFGSGGEPNYVSVSRSLSRQQSGRVASHEVSHLIDQTAGEISTEGLNAQFRKIYNDLNNPQGYGKAFGPENNKYRGADVPRELVAEAVRAYMADPNYIKTVAPEVAARIRAHVNANPKLKDVIQFNAGGIPLVRSESASGYFSEDDLLKLFPENQT